MIETKIPVLPPDLKGDTQYILTLTIDEILWELETQPVQVKVSWWGESQNEGQIFTPVDVENFTKSKIGDVLFVRYEVKTSAAKFTTYLKDASPLKVDVINIDDHVVGSSLVNNLEQITESSCGLEGYYPVVNSSTKEIIANLRIHFLLLKDYQEKTRSKSASSVSNSIGTRRMIRSRSKSSKSPPTRGRNPNRVQFSEGSSQSVSPIRNRNSMKKYSPGKKSPKKTTPLANSIVTELLNQSQELRKSMQEKLNSNFGVPQTRKPNYPSFDFQAESRYAPREAIPSWNLPVDRMRVLACVSKIEVNITSVQITPVVMEKINKDLKSKPRDSTALSFFVKFKLPGDNEETSLCTRKTKGNLAEFHEKRTIPITFTSDTLEEWWNYKTDFKIYSRHLGQRIPLLIGEASLGMKYILLHDRYTGGAPLSLPVYISNSLYRDLKLPPKTSEIVGNIHLSIQLSYRGSVKNNPAVKNACSGSGNAKEDETSDNYTEKAPSEPENIEGSTYRSTTESVKQPSTSAPRERITITSRPRPDSSTKMQIFKDTLYLEMRVSVTDSYDVFHVKHRNLDLCEGQVSQGQDLVITSVLFLPGDDGSIHNRLMLSRLSQNFLILQVWRKDQLLGIAKIGTEPIHEVFKSGEIESDKCRTFYDGVFDVVDIFDGQKVTELKIKVRVGNEEYIEPPDLSSSSTLCQQQATKNDKETQHTDEKAIIDCKSVQTSFIDSETNKNEFSEDSADVNDNNCDISHDEVIDSENNETDYNNTNHSTVNVEICIEEARNLPYLRNNGEKVEPRVYATLLEHTSKLATPVKVGTCPVWNYVVSTKIDIEYIRNPRKYLILKVWHFRGEPDKDCTDPERDQVLGYVAVDLTPLKLTAFTQVSGWYNITDWLGKCRGQMKLSVTPLESILRNQECYTSFALNLQQDEFNDTSVCVGNNDDVDYFASGHYTNYPSHLIPHQELMIRSRHKSNPDLSLISEPSQIGSKVYRDPSESYWRAPHPKQVDPTEANSISMLERTLNSHLAELNLLTNKWLQQTEDKESDNLDDSTNRTFTIDEADRNDSVILIETENDDLHDLQTAEQVVNKNLENLRNFMKQGAGLIPETGRSSGRTSHISEDLPRDDQPNLMDLGLVLEDLEQILDLETDRSQEKNQNESQEN